MDRPFMSTRQPQHRASCVLPMEVQSVQPLLRRRQPPAELRYAAGEEAFAGANFKEVIWRKAVAGRPIV